MTATQRTPQANDPILQDVVNRLVEAYHPLRMYLFGSRARGNENLNSDYDILIIVGNDVASELKSAGLAYKSLWGISVPVDVLVWTDQEFQKRLHLPNSLPSEVVREGVLLHVA